MCAALNDFTAAATIRQTAMRLFAERGVGAVTIRQIASAAGVSPSLVIHHYGTKEDLKKAVDDRAMALVDALVDELMKPSDDGGPATSFAAVFAERLEREPVLPAYMRRLLVDGGTPAEALFRGLFEATLAGFASLEALHLVRPALDDRVRAAFLLANDLAVVLLRDQIRAALGSDPLARSGMEAWTAEVFDVYTNGIFAGGDAALSPAHEEGDST